MQPELPTPELLVAKGIETEDLFAFSDQILRLMSLRLYASGTKDKDQE